MNINRLLVSLLALSCTVGGAPAQSQGFPNKPIRLIVPYPAGESIDSVARLTAQHWSAALGQPIVVDNRGGAGGTIGTEAAAKAPNDGYTLLWGNVGPLAIGPSLYKKLGYDVVKDFAPVSQIANLPFVLFTSPVLPANTLAEVTAYARANPGKLNFGSTGVGSGLHLIGEMYKSQAGIDIVHVPYKGVAQALPEMMAGRVQLAFNTIPAFLPHVKAGRLKAVVITANTRSPLLPEVPTSAEAGMPTLIGASWHGVLAPAGTPKEVLARLQQTLAAALAVPELRNQIISQGAEPVGSTPEEFGKFMAGELAKWRIVVEASGARAE
ncbi:MAG: tripartite tricarboxylate transporter substrate binding protein [Proteobacteria bacterium]|nr:tripartite tricarboxylate transporter substrate binding protein [Pseudomonadota bacterium]